MVLFIYTTLGLYHVQRFFNPGSCSLGGAAPRSPLKTQPSSGMPTQVRISPESYVFQTGFQDTVQPYGMHTQRTTFRIIIIFCFSLTIWVLCSRKAKTQSCHYYLPSLRNHRWWTDRPTNVVTRCSRATLLSFRQEHQTFPSRTDKHRLIEDRRWNLSCVVWSDVNNSKKREERDFIHFFYVYAVKGGEKAFIWLLWGVIHSSTF